MNNPIHVLCVMSTLERGGAESMVMSLLRNIDRRLVQFDFVKHTKQVGSFEEEIKELGGIIYIAPRYKVYNYLQYVYWWGDFLDKHPEYIIIHGHFFSISSIYFSIAQSRGRLTIGHSHCTKTRKEQVVNPIKHLMSNYLVSKIEDYSNYCMACSTEAGKWVFKKKPFIILNNAIDADSFCASNSIAGEIRNEFSLGNMFVLGNVSRFDLQKNPYATLEVFRLVHRERNNSRLLWIGDGPMRLEIENKAKELGIYDDIIFTGVRSDVNRLLQAMDAFIFPSFYEGLGIAAVEAQAAGVRTFCSDAVPKEAAVTNLCQFLPLDDLQLWANEICKVPAAYEHPIMKEQIVNAGYDIHDTAKWLQGFYLSVVKNRIEQ